MAEVHVDRPAPVAQIVLDAGIAATNYSLSGSTITLDNSETTATVRVQERLIDVASGNHVINSSVALVIDASITGNGSLNLAGGATGHR